MHPSRSGLRLIRTVLASLQLVSAAMLAALIVVLAATVAPSLFGYQTFIVLSGSMEPALHVGAVAVVQPVKVEALQVGDIVTYRTSANPDELVTHRVVDVQTDSQGQTVLTTKGDANGTADSVPVQSGAVLGRVVYNVPAIGYVADFSKSMLGRILLLVLPALLLIGDYVRKRMETRRAALVGGAVVTSRTRALLDRGQEAFQAGQLDLAAQAADGVLQVDAGNEEAWLLKAQTAKDEAARTALLQAGLAINPRAARIATALQDLQQQRTAVA